jgi:hypothetical protein
VACRKGPARFAAVRRGQAYQQDLGPDTEQAAAAIQTYDPDASWTPTGDLMTEPDPE